MLSQLYHQLQGTGGTAATPMMFPSSAMVVLDLPFGWFFFQTHSTKFPYHIQCRNTGLSMESIHKNSADPIEHSWLIDNNMFSLKSLALPWLTSVLPLGPTISHAELNTVKYSLSPTERLGFSF